MIVNQTGLRTKSISDLTKLPDFLYKILSKLEFRMRKMLRNNQMKTFNKVNKNKEKKLDLYFYGMFFLAGMTLGMWIALELFK